MATNRSSVLFRLFEVCKVDVPRALVAFARAREVDWCDSRCVEWFPYDFASCKVGAVSAYDVPGGKLVRDQRRVTEPEI